MGDQKQAQYCWRGINRQFFQARQTFRRKFGQNPLHRQSQITQFALFFGGTTLLIMVGVALDTLQVIESYLLTQKYDGLIKSGRIQGRSSQGVQIGQPQ